ncbi:MAG: hypothetical protein ABL999_16765 [Pyrinomonadaceae bacterium]
MSVLHSQIEADGRVKVPPQIMDLLELEAGNDLEFRVTDRTVRILPSAGERIRRAQERVRKYIRPGVSIVDELIADRRAEAEKE